MAEVTISALTPLDAPLGPLTVEVLDSSDNSASTSGTNKKVVVGGLYQIGEAQVLGSAGEFDFDSIPAGFSRLVVKGSIRSTAVASGAPVYLFFNSDTTESNYSRQHDYVFNGAASLSEAAQPRVLLVTGASAGAGQYAAVSIDIEDYAGSSVKGCTGKMRATTATGEHIIGQIAMAHNSMTAAITRIRIQDASHPTSGLVGTLTLYGEI